MNNEIQRAVRESLLEDIGSGDISASLIAEDLIAEASIITREAAIMAGQAWAHAVYQQLDPRVELNWLVKEGEQLKPNQTIAVLRGAARTLLSGERAALNWLQTLSGTATLVARYVKALSGTTTQLLDTRKTIPGLRVAQKYAVTVGGGHNHRMGLYDAFLIKENHIISCGSIKKAVQQARQHCPDKPVEVEVETLDEFTQALEARSDIIMLDNFSLGEMCQAVRLNQGQAKLEVSGNVTIENIRDIAQTGVDFISVGALTKHVQAIDLSMRFAPLL